MGLATPATSLDSLPPGVKTVIDRLRLTHELWSSYSPEFDLYLAAYEGGRDIITEKHLAKHQRENIEDYNDRLKRAHYMNYCEPLVDFFTNFIFSETIDRSGGTNSDLLNEFLADVDRRGNNIDFFMRSVCDDMQIFGMVYILVDTPKLNSSTSPEVITKAFEKENKIRPYWVVITPNEIVDWVVDDFDEFEYVKRRQIVNIISDGVIDTVEKYTEWYKDRIEINGIVITDPAKPYLLPKELLDNPLGSIPIMVARYKRSKRNPYMGNSFLRDFAYNNREIMNLTSLQQDFLYRQAFNILAVETESNIPLAEQQDGEIGTSNRLEYPKGATIPAYITPPSDPAQYISETIARIKNEMFLRASQDTLTELFNGEKASGFSQAQSFSKTVPFIAARADTLEKIENALMQLTLQFIGKSWDGKIKYKDRYEITNLTDALTQLQVLARDLMLPSETFVKEELKRIVHEFDGKLPPETMKEVEDQIDAMDFSDWQETQKEALVGKSNQGNSPGAQQKSKSSGTTAEAAAEAKTTSAAATKKVKK